MKVFITKHALTAGIEECEVEVTGDGMAVDYSGSYPQYFHKEGRDWHRTRESAVKRAEAMRKAKVASLQKSLAVMKAMRFD
jgi:hypothetical protein